MASIAITIGKMVHYIGINSANAKSQKESTHVDAEKRSDLYNMNLKARGKVEISDNFLTLSGLSAENYSKYGSLFGNIVGNAVIETDDKIKIEIIDALIDVTKSNTIKQTELINRTGTIKEFIQANDYKITLSGNLFATYSTPSMANFPFADLILLNKILSRASSFKIASQYLSIFDIDRVAFVSADFNQSSNNYMNTMKFKLNLVSDEDYKFLLEE